MKWSVLSIVVVMWGIVYALRAAPGMSIETAREHLRNGALLVDVRTAAEFQSGPLTNAVNIPLNELQEKLPARVPDRSRVMLLHCRSGRRSGIAEKELRALGYTNAFNIGSYGRAREIVGGKAE
jgi:phage shock protein E